MTPEEIELARQQASLLGGQPGVPPPGPVQQTTRLLAENQVRANLGNANVTNSFDPGPRVPAPPPQVTVDPVRANLSGANVTNAYPNVGSRPTPMGPVSAAASVPVPDSVRAAMNFNPGAPAAPSASAPAAAAPSAAAPRAAAGGAGGAGGGGGAAKWFGSADDWRNMGQGAVNAAKPNITPPTPGRIVKGAGALQGAMGAVNAYQGVKEGDYLKAGVGAADALAGAALFTPAAPAAAAYLGVRGAWDLGQAAGGAIYNSSWVGDGVKNAIGKAANSVANVFGAGVSDADTAKWKQQTAENNAKLAAINARAPGNAAAQSSQYTFDQVLGMLPEKNKLEMLRMAIADPAKFPSIGAQGPDGKWVSVPLDRDAALKAYTALLQAQAAPVAAAGAARTGPVQSAAPAAPVAQAQPMSPEAFAAATTPTQGVVSAFGANQNGGNVQQVATQELPAFDGGPGQRVVIMRGTKEFAADPRADGSGFTESRLGLPQLPANATPEQRLEYLAQMREIGGAANAELVGKQIAQDSSNAASMANAATAAAATRYSADQQFAATKLKEEGEPIYFGTIQVPVLDEKGNQVLDANGRGVFRTETQPFYKGTGQPVPKKPSESKGPPPDGTRVRGKDGKLYEVRKGQPVLIEGQ